MAESAPALAAGERVFDILDHDAERDESHDQIPARTR